MPITDGVRAARAADGRLVAAHLALAGVPLRAAARAAGVNEKNLRASLSGERHLPAPFRVAAAHLVADAIATEGVRP